jgi:hypothetical protein
MEMERVFSQVTKVSGGFGRLKVRQSFRFECSPSTTTLATEFGRALRIEVEETKTTPVWLGPAWLTACRHRFALRQCWF